MDNDTMLIIILSAIAVVLLIIVIIGSNHHVKKAKFKPKFVKLSDGSVQMECGGFGGVQTTRTKRFLEEYKVDQEVSYQGRTYTIDEIKEVADPSFVKNDLKMVCYLVEKV